MASHNESTRGRNDDATDERDGSNERIENALDRRDDATQTTLERVELALGEEVAPRGSAVTVRKYADDPVTPVDLLNDGTFSVDQLTSLWLAIEPTRSLVFAGGTASGKTTGMNAVSMVVTPRPKVLTVEDTRDLQLHRDNRLASVTRERVHEGTDVSTYDLLRSAPGHRPEYIVGDEVRGEEAMTLFQAMTTGHIPTRRFSSPYSRYLLANTPRTPSARRRVGSAMPAGSAASERWTRRPTRCCSARDARPGVHLWVRRRPVEYRRREGGAKHAVVVVAVAVHLFAVVV